ncbi:MAG: T9SS type A sorting domain-containing protein [Bacteroidota bacterium]
MKYFFFTLICLVALLFSYQNSTASQVAGAELTYYNVGGSNYVVRLVVYRDCSGGAIPLSFPVSVNSLSCAQSLNITVQALPGTGNEITPVCPGNFSSCQGGNRVGIQKWEYEGQVTLPMQCIDWTFSFTITERSNAITTLMNDSVLYVEAQLNNSVYQNTSPLFATFPNFFVYLGQNYCISEACIDPDGDSLVYSMITPRVDANTNCSYAVGYNLANPVSSSPPVILFSTGDLCIYPTVAGEVGVIAVLVQEYRNGTLIGSIVRDCIVYMEAMSNTAPYLNVPGFSFSICAGNEISLDVYSFDSDSGQTLTLTWNAGIAGATFATAGSPHPTGHFHWATTAADIRPQPYTLIMILNDDGCPTLGAQVYSISIFVTSDSLPPVPTIQFISPYLITQPGYSYQWYYSTDSITFILTGNGTDSLQPVDVGFYYVVITNSNGCYASSETLYFNPLSVNSLESDDIVILPNPSSGIAILHTMNYINDATLTIYNSCGQQVQHLTHISGQAVTLHCEQFREGLYFLRITENDKIVAVERLMIAD